MKKISFLIATTALFGFASCNKVEEPDSADFSWYYYSDYTSNLLDLTKAEANPDTIELSDQICFVANSNDADSYVIWTGEPGHEYDGRDLVDSLIKDTVNNVALKAAGVALSSTDGKNRKYKTYTFSNISPVGQPFQMYGTARNYDYTKGEYAEVKVGPYAIVVVDSQVDLWNSEDPRNSNGETKYSMNIKVSKGTGKYTTITKTSEGAKGSYEIVYEDAANGVKPGIKITYPTGNDASDCVITFKANNCVPVTEDGTIEYLAKFGTYKWTVDLSSPKIITLKSQSAAEDAKSGDPMTKDYEFSAVEYTE